MENLWQWRPLLSIQRLCPYLVLLQTPCFSSSVWLTLCILHKMHWHGLCLSELLKFVSKLELAFYEEVAGLREEKTALFGQGHWKVLTGKKSCKRSSTHLTVLHKKSAWKLFSCPSLQDLSEHPWNQHRREVYFITFCCTIAQGIYSWEIISWNLSVC